MGIFLVHFLLVLSCFSVTSTSAVVPETFRPPCCSPALTTRGSTTRFLRESGVLNEIEKTADALLEEIARTHFAHPTKRRKVSRDATFEPEPFLRTRLKTATQELFDHKDFQRWIEYVDEAKAKHPEREISVIPTLLAHFSDEELYNILEHAVTIPEYANLATELQAEQVRYWTKRNEDPDKVFEILGLGNTRKNMFENPKFLYYVTYFSRFRAKDPAQPTSMAATILKHQSAASLIRQIEEAETSGSEKVRDVAKRLEDDLMTHLVQTQPLEKALEALDIDFVALVLLSPDTLKSICVKLLKGYVTKRTDTKVPVISELVKRFGEDLVVESVLTTERDDEVGVALRSELHEYWLSNGRSAPDIEKLLYKLQKADTSDSLGTQINTEWFLYLDYLVEKKRDGLKLLLTQLETQLKPESLPGFFRKAETYPNLERAMKKSPLRMFKVLGLAKNQEAVIKHPMFPIWLAYKQNYDGRNPAHKKSLAAIFAHHFGSENVQQLKDELQEVLEDKQTPLARAGLLSLDDLSLESWRESEDWKHVTKRSAVTVKRHHKNAKRLVP
ncbi:hypothetical protein PsorP6_010275 [Peronosclerospora sorghi]|uniref:Uncharacterized protein n=1 Tax=Peronosclerospora sorghi TaxID=230839 RepID=A0ACC0VVD3_9STRA|nr:hypothetical protein PsorP6_010275 [Peronosclerospora sorghi]